MRLWWYFQLWRWKHKARYAKARWLALKETVEPQKYGGPIKHAEDTYARMVINVKTYQLLLNPNRVPKAQAKESA